MVFGARSPSSASGACWTSASHLMHFEPGLDPRLKLTLTAPCLIRIPLWTSVIGNWLRPPPRLFPLLESNLTSTTLSEFYSKPCPRPLSEAEQVRQSSQA